MRFASGIDLGGSFVKYALVSSSGDIVTEGKFPVGGRSKREDILRAIEFSIQKTIDKANEGGMRVDGIGIGSPGIICDSVVLGGAENLDGWEDIDLGSLFGRKFNLPVIADNDANVMGLGEAMFGSARGCTDVLFFTVGTGIGGAIIVDGKLYGGYKNRGAELGHVTIDHNGIDCNCGGKGCLEAYASTSALVEQYARAAGKDPEAVNGHFIVSRYHEGEEAAVKCMKEHTDYLGHGIAGFINTFSPQKVVIGGGISEAGQFYIDMIKKSAMTYAMPDCSSFTEIVAADLGNNAGCMGAASLIFKEIND